MPDKENSQLWRDRYGHLNFQSLQVLNQRQMIIGLPKVKQFNNCESCTYANYQDNHLSLENPGEPKKGCNWCILIYEALCKWTHLEEPDTSYYSLMISTK